MINLITLVLGLIIGTVTIFVVVYVYYKDRKIALGGSILIFVGTILLGLSIWRSVELSIDPGGGITAKFSQDLGAATADVKGQIAELELKVTELNDDISTFKKEFPGIRTSKEVASMRMASGQKFKENSEYSVLIFYRHEQRQEARAIERALLTNGYKSSSMRSELKEAIRQFPSGNAWIIYTDKGKERIEEVEETIDSLKLGMKLTINSKSSTLRRGEIQVLLF